MSGESGSSSVYKQAMEVASTNAPWRKDVAWWVVLIQGIVLVVFGVFVLTNQSVANIVVLVAGILLIVDGVLAGLAALRGRVSSQASTLNLIGAGVALVVGVLVTLGVLVPFFDLSTAALLAALALIAVGAISLVIELFMRPPGRGLFFTRLIAPLVWIGFGLLVLINRGDGSPNTLQTIGWLSLVAGVVLLVVAFLRYRGSRPAAA